jgi:ABC-2 type transport system ATP-binding protein
MQRDVSEPTRTPYAIEICGLKKHFSSFEVLKGINLAIRHGEMFALLGPNGAGKSTLFSILSTLRTPSEGCALIMGFDVVRERAAVRRRISVVFQDAALEQSLSARDNLELMAQFQGMSLSAARRRADDLLQLLQLTTWANRPSKTLSGGLQRRLELARALVGDPSVLFLDEATLGLDAIVRRQFWSELAEMARRGRTIFFTTHYMDEAEIADRIAVIDRGDIVAVETPTSFKRSLGGEVVRLMTDDDTVAEIWLRRHGYAIDRNADGLELTWSDTAVLLPSLLRELPVTVNRVESRTLSIEDVFLRRTRQTLSHSGSEPLQYRRVGLA